MPRGGNNVPKSEPLCEVRHTEVLSVVGTFFSTLHVRGMVGSHMMWRPVAFAIAVVMTTLFGPVCAIAHHGRGVWLESESSSSDPYIQPCRHSGERSLTAPYPILLGTERKPFSWEVTMFAENSANQKCQFSGWCKGAMDNGQ
jgi:hypothetical protein